VTPRTRRSNPDGTIDDDATQWLSLLTTDPADGTTYTFSGASDLGVMPAVPQYIETGPGTAPLALPPARHPEQPRWLSGPADPAPVAGEVARGWARIFTVTCEYPAAPGAATIPCDQEHRDDHAGTYPGLYRSAWDAGWRMDKLGLWACPGHAQDSGQYQALYPVQHWHPAAPAAREAGDYETEFRLRVAAENALLRDVHARAAKHVRPVVTA
jgi:hypothetical protein